MTDKNKFSRIAVTVLAILLGALSLAAGAAKIMLVPEEARFLGQFGFTEALVISFGLLQAFGGLMLFMPRARLIGALIVAIGFALSAGLLMAVKNWAFGGVSLVPVALSVFVAYSSFCRSRSLSRAET